MVYTLFSVAAVVVIYFVTCSVYFFDQTENEILELKNKLVFHRKNMGVGFYWNAQNQCGSYGGKLVSLHSLEEQKLVSDWMQKMYERKQPHYWLGFNRANPREEFKWEDGSAVQFTNWYFGYPKRSHTYA